MDAKYSRKATLDAVPCLIAWQARAAVRIAACMGGYFAAMSEQRRRVVELALAALAALLLFAYVAGQRGYQRVAPTPNVPMARTAAVETFSQSLTATGRYLPEATVPVLTSLQSTAIGTETPQPTSECLSLRFVRDITVPDNTEMGPAEVFTKTWQVENNGTCPWRAGYQVVLIGGVAMGGSPFRVAQPVGPGGSIQISIKMAAPTNQAGTLQGTWKMSDESGTAFGDYLSVVIVVPGSTLRKPTPSPLATP
jgi:hypothetical protein